MALIIAVPASWYFTNKWLQDFAYCTEISWWIFAAAGLSTLVLTLLTVCYQVITAALKNPVNSLRSEWFYLIAIWKESPIIPGI